MRKLSWLVAVAALMAAGLYFLQPVARLRQWRETRRERQEKIQYAARRLAVFDLRSQGEFIRALRSKGTAAYPAFGRAQVVEVALPLAPLGSISNVTTVYGNESGEFLVYRSDEHGFHNPPGLWTLEKLDAALVGDSFAHGASVPSPSNLAAMIRLRFPATLNLGHAGNGPLSELGSILEYLPRRRPRMVLWAYSVENDVPEGLEREKRCPELRGYLARPPRLQQLEQRQAEIDRELRRLGEARAAAAAPPGRAQPDFKTFGEVLQTARDAVAGWGGRLVFVYLPSRGSLLDGKFAGWRAQTLEACQRLAVPVLDIERRFAAEREYLGDYFYRHAGHYTETGYRRAGQMIVEELEKAGLD